MQLAYLCLSCINRPIRVYGSLTHVFEPLTCISDRKSDQAFLTFHLVATLRKAGFYSVLVRPGFRIIVLNTNVAYRFNL